MMENSPSADRGRYSWSIGATPIGGPLVLAPLAGYSCAPFRLLCRRAGADLVYTEMIAARGLKHRNRKTFELLHLLPAERPVAVQIFGDEPQVMAEATRHVEAAGADIIDINMGCPVPKVIRSGSGAALMSRPDRAVRIAAAVAESAQLPVTCKIRAGVADGDMSYLDLARRFQEVGIAAIAIHARTVRQGFEGSADHEHTKRLAEALDIPVIASGDIFEPDDIIRVLRKTGCAGVMLARGAMGRPWLFTQAAALLHGRTPPPAPSIGLRLGIALCHAQMLVNERGYQRGMHQMRGQLAWYTKGIPGGRKLRGELNTVERLSELADLMREHIVA